MLAFRLTITMTVKAIENARKTIDDVLAGGRFYN